MAIHGLAGMVAQTQDRLEDALGAVDMPWIVRQVLAFIAEHPGTVLTILGILLSVLVLNVWQSRTQSRQHSQQLSDYTGSFPRRRWERMGQLDATAILSEALRVFGRRLDKEGVACHYGALGVLYLQRGDEAQAERMLLKALDLFEAMAIREGIAVYGRHLSLLYYEQNKLERALSHAQRSLDMYRALGIRPDDDPQAEEPSLRDIIDDARTEVVDKPTATDEGMPPANGGPQDPDGTRQG